MVVEAALLEPASSPDPGRDHRVDEGRHGEGEVYVRVEERSLGEGPGNDGACGGTEAVADDPRRVVLVFEAEVTELSDAHQPTEATCGDAVADEPVCDRGDHQIHKVLVDYISGVFRSNSTYFEKDEAELHGRDLEHYNCDPQVVNRAVDPQDHFVFLCPGDVERDIHLLARIHVCLILSYFCPGYFHSNLLI